MQLRRSVKSREVIHRLATKPNPEGLVGQHPHSRGATINLKNAVFLNVPPCGSCENRHFGGTCRCSLLPMLVTVKIVPSS
jgi:hypothetical protein